MSTPEPPGMDNSENTIPRWQALVLALVAWLVGVPFVHGVIPWLLSKLTPYFGWINGRPGPWNLTGLVFILAASVILVWVMVNHLTRAPEKVKLEATPSYLIETGPYRFSRNPMYVAELGLWLGWAILFGSIAVLVGFFLLWIAMNYRAIPREERNLEERFGNSYREYKDRVRRWLGRSKPL